MMAAAALVHCGEFSKDVLTDWRALARLVEAAGAREGVFVG